MDKTLKEEEKAAAFTFCLRTSPNKSASMFTESGDNKRKDIVVSRVPLTACQFKCYVFEGTMSRLLIVNNYLLLHLHNFHDSYVPKDYS